MSSNNFDAPVFDPNAGREEAYEARKKAFFEKLLNDDNVNKINKKKAGKYFDSQFEQDWNNEEMDRRIAFSRKSFDDFRKQRMAEFNNISAQADTDIADLEALNAEKEYMDKGYTYTKDGWTLTNAPTQPTQPTQPVRDKNGRTREEILALQQEMVDAGYDLGKFGPKGNGVDGIWGKNTQAAYDMYIQQGKKPYNEVFPEPPINNTPETKPDNQTGENQGDWHWNKSAKKNSQGQLMWNKDFWRDRYFGDSYYNYGNNRYRIAVNKASGQSYLVDLVNGRYIQADENMWGGIDDDAMNSRLASGSGWMDITKDSRLFQYKIGGIIKQILKNSNVFPFNIK